MIQGLRAYIEGSLSPRQRDVCYAGGSFVVHACPGSGKTRTVGTRLAWRSANCGSTRSGVAAVSFTNVACDEIGRHLTELGLPARPEWPHFLGTIDSFVNQFVFLPFGHLVMECSVRPRVVHPDDSLHTWVREKMRDKDLEACYRKGCNAASLEFQADGSLAFCVGRRQPKCDRDRCGDVKAPMVRAGFALPGDAMYWAMKVLADPVICRAVATRFRELIVDEAQDTSETQVNIIRRLNQAGCAVTLVGDPDQAIFAFHSARPDLFTAFEREWQTMQLTENFRSSQLICNATHRFAHSLATPAIAAGPDAGDGAKPLVIRYRAGEETNLLPRFREVLAQHGIQPRCSAILAWRHDVISKVSGAARVEWPPRVHAAAKALARAAVYRDHEARMLGEAHRSAMWAVLRICFDTGDYGRDYSAVESVGRREWRRWTWRLLGRLPSADTALSDWGPVTRPIMAAFLEDAAWPCAVQLGKILQRCNHTTACAPVSAFVRVPSVVGDVTCKVIHAAKGETYEAVMVVCGPARRGRECDIAQWLHPTDPDAQRTGYVAMTRPRKLLVLALPEDTPEVLIDELRETFDV